MGDAAEDEGTLGELERAVGREQPIHVIVCGGPDFAPRVDDATRFCAWLHSVRPAVVHHSDASEAARWAAKLAARIEGVSVEAHEADGNAEILRDAFESGGRDRPIVVAFPGDAETDDMVGKARAARCRVIFPHEETRRK